MEALIYLKLILNYIIVIKKLIIISSNYSVLYRFLYK